MRSATAAGAILLFFSVLIGGCASAQRPIVRTEPPPAYEALAAAHNERVDRLSRVWARAVVELWYTDDRGRTRREQGEGHFQVRRPGGVALSIGKLGETYAWLGSDEERFWFFDKFDTPRATVGRFENADKPCAESFGLPADPARMLDLMGMTAIPETGGVTAWSADGRAVVAVFDRAGAEERIHFEPRYAQPVRIEIQGREPGDVIVSTLERYANVRLGGFGGFFPRLASRIEIRHESSGTRVALHLADMEDGSFGRGQLSDAAFDFEALRAIFRPSEIIDLDQGCDRPAIDG